MSDDVANDETALSNPSMEGSVPVTSGEVGQPAGISDIDSAVDAGSGDDAIAGNDDEALETESSSINSAEAREPINTPGGKPPVTLMPTAPISIAWDQPTAAVALVWRGLDMTEPWVRHCLGYSR